MKSYFDTPIGCNETHRVCESNQIRFFQLSSVFEHTVVATETMTLAAEKEITSTIMALMRQFPSAFHYSQRPICRSHGSCCGHSHRTIRLYSMVASDYVASDCTACFASEEKPKTTFTLRKDPYQAAKDPS